MKLQDIIKRAREIKNSYNTDEFEIEQDDDSIQLSSWICCIVTAAEEEEIEEVEEEIKEEAKEEVKEEIEIEISLEGDSRKAGIYFAELDQNYEYKFINLRGYKEKNIKYIQDTYKITKENKIFIAGMGGSWKNKYQQIYFQIEGKFYITYLEKKELIRAFAKKDFKTIIEDRLTAEIDCVSREHFGNRYLYAYKD